MLFLCFQMDQHTQKGLSMSDLSIYTFTQTFYSSRICTPKPNSEAAFVKETNCSKKEAAWAKCHISIEPDH